MRDIGFRNANGDRDAERHDRPDACATGEKSESLEAIIEHVYRNADSASPAKKEIQPKVGGDERGRLVSEA